MAAMAGASGARTWLQAQHATWLTPKRMRAATVGVFAAAAIGSSLTLSGSSGHTGAHQHAPPAAHAAQSAR
jgi:hypothetical protein